MEPTLQLSRQEFLGAPTDSANLSQDVLGNQVFVASLIDRLTDAFGTAKDLYHKLQKDSKSDDDHDEPQDSAHGSDQGRRDSHFNLGDALGRHVRWSLDRRRTHQTDSDDDELICTASLQVRTTYARAYRKLGEEYARGDDMAKIQIQSHIIKLQQVLIRIHQDLMLSNYTTISSSHSQLIHLVQTVRTARGAALQALDLLYQRLLAGPLKIDPKPHLPIPGAFPKPPGSRRSSSSSSSSTPEVETPRPHHPPPAIQNPNLNKLFCGYALDLQSNPTLPLSPSFQVGGSTRCPSCHAAIRVRPLKAWEVVVDSPGHRRVGRRFLVRNRFVVKCHSPAGGFACVLCARYGEADTTCRSIGALMEHLWREHGSGELERDEDIVGGR